MGPFWMSCGRSGRLRWADRNQTERGYISCLRLWRHSWLPVHHRYRGDAVPEPYPSKHCFHHFPLYSGGCPPVGHYASVRTCIHNQRMPDGRGILLPCKAKKRRQYFVYRKIFQRGRPAKDPLRRCRMVVNTGSKHSPSLVIPLAFADCCVRGLFLAAALCYNENAGKHQNGSFPTCGDPTLLI